MSSILIKIYTGTQDGKSQGVTLAEETADDELLEAAEEQGLSIRNVCFRVKSK